MSATMPTAEQLHFLSVKALSKRYADSFALTNVSLEVNANEILGLIGPNGAGKTTLLECVAGLLPIDSGALIWSQQTAAHSSHNRESMFYLPDQISPYPEQYAIHVLEFFMELFRTPAARLDHAVDVLALKPVLAKRVGDLSKGYNRRLLLCITLLAKQKLLLLDEPFDGLDLRQTRQTMDLLQTLKHEGKSLLLSIHQIADAEKICDRFLLLSNGALLGSGTLNELRVQADLPNGSLEEVFLALT
jgi:ABC-2 type transport system ATP-binding protein